MFSPPADASTAAAEAIAALPSGGDPTKLVLPRLIADGKALTDQHVSEVRGFFDRGSDRSSVQWLTAARLLGGIPMLEAIRDHDKPEPVTPVTAVVAVLSPDVVELTGCGLVDLVVIGDSVGVPQTWVNQLLETVAGVASVWPSPTLTAEWVNEADTVFESVELRMIRTALRAGLVERGVDFVDLPWHPETICDTTLTGATCPVTSLAVTHNGDVTRFNLAGTSPTTFLPQPTRHQSGIRLAEQLTALHTHAGLAVSEMIRLCWESALRRVGAVATRENPDLMRHDFLDAGRNVPAETVAALNPNIDRLVSTIVSDTTSRIGNLVDQVNSRMWALTFDAVKAEGLAPAVDPTAALQWLTGELAARLTVTKTGSVVPHAPPAGLARRFLTTTFTPTVTDLAASTLGGVPAGIIAAGIQAATDPETCGALLDGDPETVDVDNLRWEPSANVYSAGRSHRHDPNRGYELHCNCGWKLATKT